MKILFIDDNPSDYELARITLKEIPDLEFVSVESFIDFKKEYVIGKYNAIISDYNLSDELGTDIFLYVKNVEPEIPFIIISGALGEARAVEILKLGVTDYVLKDSLGKLPVALNRALKESETKKQATLAQEQLQLSEEKYRKVVEDQTEYIVRWKPCGEIVFANKSFLDFNQINEEDIYDKNYYTLVPEKEYIRFKNKINSITPDKPAITDTHQATHPFYGDYWQEWTDRAFFDKKGEIIEFQSVGRDITELKKQEQFLTLLNNSNLVRTGESYFSDLTGYCCGCLEVKFAFVGLYLSEINSIQTISFKINNVEYENFIYNLTDTPCNNVINKEICSYPENVQLLFPKDEDLKKMGIESYVGIPLFDCDRNALGILVVMDDKPMKNYVEKEKILSLIALRTSNELNRSIIEKKLAASEEKYRLLIENMSEGILYVDLDYTILFANLQFCQMSEYSINELIGKKATELFLDMEGRIIMNIANEKRKKGETSSYEIEFKTKSGKKIWVNINGAPLKNETGEIIGSIGSHTDITQIKESENLIRESEKRYRGLFEKMNDGLLLSNPDGDLIMVNPSFCKMLEYSEEELIGKNGYQLFHDKNIQNDLKDKTKARREGKSELYELEFICKSGKKIWMQISASPSFDVKGKFLGVMSILTDITETKNKELQLKATINELNDRNNEAMQFNYIVSHNLRAPIASIIGLSRLIDSPDTREEEKPLIIKHITDSCLKMDELVKDLNVILSSRSNINTQKDKVNIFHLLNSIKNTLSNSIKESDCELKIKIAEDANELFISKSYLESIIYNLLSNAIKFRSEKRKPEVMISVESMDNGIKILVSDNGIGIDLEKHGSTVFGLYKRFNLNVEGKGLGLHMTKTQVEALGGTISIQSEIETGTTFIVNLKR